MEKQKYRIEISVKNELKDPHAEFVKKSAKAYFGIDLKELRIRRVYSVDARINFEEIRKAAEEIANPILENWRVNEYDALGVRWLLRIGLKPGVTDNVGRTAKEAIGDIIGRKLADDENVFGSTEYLFFDNGLERGEIEKIARGLLANELIESITLISGDELNKVGLPLHLPYVELGAVPEVRYYNLEVSDEELMRISREGLFALSLEEMKAIRDYYRSVKGREKFGLHNCPTDVEMEVLAQTWSEHCKHKIFNAEIEYKDLDTGESERIVSCFRTYIKRSTEEIGKKIKWLVSVFHDNAGVISFNRRWDLVYKVETHNSPSALDPYGGAITGIVGVNRDPLGTGQGAELLANVWGYCLGSPFTPPEMVPEGLLHPRRLRDGIHKGVIDGGNQSGIPYAIGWEYFDDSYIGKPLVYCGTLGKLPKRIGKVRGYEKSIKPGDLVVMAGGRIGKDGIHGATFSSEELHQGSPVQAVQIGDPITQKKLYDFIIEARAEGLYRFITDNGAGGLSSSVGEMASVCGGCIIDLSKAPLKYAGLAPWEILLSEAQERMSFAVPREKIARFLELAAKRDVEATVLGEFTDSGKFHVMYGDKTVAYLDIDFMHNGLPRMKLSAIWSRPQFEEPELKDNCLCEDLLRLLSSLNICSIEYKARQYDHEVKGLSVIKPFSGKCRDLCLDATVMMIEPLSREGVVLASAILPRYSLIDTYHMVACVIDLAFRRIIAAGGDPQHTAGLDNFCWPDPVKSEKNPDGEYKLAQLVRANKALYDYTKEYMVPCISGKDSMKNDSTRGGKKISVLPSLLFSVVSRIDDVSRALTPELKVSGDLVCVIGLTKAELGGSEYFRLLGKVGNKVPTVDAKIAKVIYGRVAKLIRERVLHSCYAVGIGGLGIGFAKIAIGGRLGLEIDLDNIPSEGINYASELLYSESSGRFIISFPLKNLKKVEKELGGYSYGIVGKVIKEKELRIKSNKYDFANFAISLDKLVECYKKPLDGV